MNQLKPKTYQNSQMNPAPIDHNMGLGVANSTSGFNLRYNPTQWDHLYNKNASAGKGGKVVIQGSSVPLAYEERTSKMPDESMFIFQNNIVSPECCPATYSTSKGCVCTASWQQYHIGYERGGNNKYPGAYPFI